MDEDHAGEQATKSGRAQASMAGAPEAAPTVVSETPRRRRRETLEQEIDRALGDEAPRVGFREEALASFGVRGLVAPSRAERDTFHIEIGVQFVCRHAAKKLITCTITRRTLSRYPPLHTTMDFYLRLTPPLKQS